MPTILSRAALKFRIFPIPALILAIVALAIAPPGEARWGGRRFRCAIGAAGVSAVPMAARVVNRVGLESNPQNFLLMHAMGPNVAGVLGSAVAAGVLLALTR